MTQLRSFENISFERLKVFQNINEECFILFIYSSAKEDKWYLLIYISVSYVLVNLIVTDDGFGSLMGRKGGEVEKKKPNVAIGHNG